MENLVPREAYDTDDTGYRHRLGLVSGAFFGLGMGCACFFLVPPTIGSGLRALFSIFTGLFCAVAFGKAFPRNYRKRLSSIIDRLYAGDPDIDVPPPPERDLRYRLPCSWKRSRNFAVGGVLYVGPLGLLFVPHKLNPSRDRSPFEIGPTKSLSLSLKAQELRGIFKLLVPRPSPLLQIIWREGSAQFLVPSPNQVLDLMGKRIREMA
jgi:hypothetical protein